MLRFMSGFGLFVVLSAQPLWADNGLTVQEILGRTLENENVKAAHIYADGTFDGTFNGISYAGVWSIEDGKFCREVTRGLKSDRNCLDLLTIKNGAGEIVAVDFLSAGARNRFRVQ